MPRWRYEPYPETLAALASVGRVVEHTRRRKSLSIRQLAYPAGVAPSTILRLERGEIAASLMLVVKVANALGGLTIGAPPVAPTGNAAPEANPEPTPERHPLRQQATRLQKRTLKPTPERHPLRQQATRLQKRPLKRTPQGAIDAGLGLARCYRNALQ